MKRGDVSLFQYDNILMEEAAQILEIETFIPLLLQVQPCLMSSLQPLPLYHSQAGRQVESC